LVLGLGLAALLIGPWLVLAARGYAQFQAWPAAAVPFGLNRVLVVHLIGVLPLTLWLSWMITSVTGTRVVWTVCGIVLGSLLVAASGLASDTIAGSSVAMTSGQNYALRLAWCIGLELPWAVALMTYVGRRFSFRGFYPIDGLICVLFAVLPILHVQQTLERESFLVSDAMINQQYAEALRLSRQLVVLGSETILGQQAWEFVGGLQAEVDRLRGQVSSPLPAAPTPEERLTRARQLYSLGQLDDVSSALGDLPRTNPDAALRLGFTAEVQGDWPAAADHYQRTLAMLEQVGELDDVQLRLLRSATERRVNNLRRMGEGRQAEQELLAGMQRWPTARDSYLMQLGYHYDMAGRTSEAIGFFEEAVAVNPKLKPIVDQHLALLQQQAQGCLMRPTRGATR
jgi:tetratricopeptide (TPR) repeat protein